MSTFAGQKRYGDDRNALVSVKRPRQEIVPVDKAKQLVQSVSDDTTQLKHINAKYILAQHND